MNLEYFLLWYNKFDEIEKLKLISKKVNECKQLSLRRKKALDAELNQNFNRVGKRGGKLTTIYARAENITRQTLDNQELLKIMVKHL